MPKAPKITYYRNPRTKTIHMTGDFPAPRGTGYSQCGNLNFQKEEIAPMNRNEVRRAQQYEFCLKCTQLLGLV